MNEWTDCKQGLPHIKEGKLTSDIVIGYLGDGCYDMLRRHTGKPWGWIYCSDRNWGKPMPTHWMPLPSPPDTTKEPSNG